MPPQRPLLFVDNQLDRTHHYPAAVLTASSALTGRDPWRVTDGRRERTWWQPTSDGVNPTGNWIQSDLGAGQSAVVDYLWLDRGHTLWGKQVVVEVSADAAAWTVVRTLAAPLQDAAVGGDPASATLASTEEGALYAIFTPSAAQRYRRVRVPFVAAFVPVIAGCMLGARHQLLGYSSVHDPDAGERTELSETSRAGYKATDTTFSWRTCELALSHIGAAEYDATMRRLRKLLFERNAPVVITLDYGTKPERSWLYQWEGRRFSMPTNRVLRSGRFTFRELGHSII